MTMHSATAFEHASTTAARVAATLDVVYERGFVMGDGEKRLPTFPSGMSREAGLALAALVREERATTTLETGMALGLSTLWMVDGLLGCCGAAAPSHTAIDPYQATDWRRAALRLMVDAGDLVSQGIVTHAAEDSTLALPRFVAERRRFDLMLVDGGHLYELAFCDILFGSRLVRPGGLLVVDDVWMPSVSTAVNYFVSNGLVEREVRPEIEAAKRFALLRVPAEPVRRAWDHFESFDVGTKKRV